MAHRSWLLVPAADDNKLIEAVSAGADVVVLDLAVPPELRSIARSNALEWLLTHRQQVLEGRRFARWVRIGALDSRFWRDDLVTVMDGAPDGIVLPNATGPEAVQQLAAEIYELEQRHHLPSGSMKIVPQVADCARSATMIHSYAEIAHPRLTGLAWCGGSLAEALGATRTRDETGGWSDALRHVRAQTLLAAKARDIMALEITDSSDGNIAGTAAAAHADGFAGMFASHPEQVAAINQAFGEPAFVREPILPRAAMATF